MGNCISPLFDNMGTCISKCIPKRPNKSSPVQDKLVISELRSTAPQNVFSNEFLIACMKNNFYLATQLVPIPRPAHASQSKVCTEASNCLMPSPQPAKLGYSSSSQQAMLMDFPSCPYRHLPASPSVSQRYTTNTSCASSYASASSSRNITRRNCRIKEVERASVPSSCSGRCGATTSPAGSKRHRAGGSLGIPSNSRRRVGRPESDSDSDSVDSNSLSTSNSSCSSSIGSSPLLRRKEIFRHVVRFESSKGSVVGIKEESSRLLKRKSEKAVHPISCEDEIDRKTSSDSLASAIDINNLHISLDCFIFV